MITPGPALFVGGPPQHGVVRYAVDVATAVTARRVDEHEPPPPLVRSVDAVRAGVPLHIHFTDRLFGTSPEAAAEAVEQLATLAPITVTVHDVPQPSDGTVSLPRRAECYRRVLRAARGGVCNSEHERSFLREVAVSTRDLTVIPLAVEHPAERRSLPEAPDLERAVALIGFVYPGKGHAEVIDAVAAVGGGVVVVALGAASTGHEGDVAELRRRAASCGVDFSVTGYLSDDDLLRRCASVAVPIAAHQHISASGSILAWLSAGRRPLVLDSRYAREMLALRPDTLTLVTSRGMAKAIARAIENPASTWLDPSISTAPHLSDVAAAYELWWSETGA